MSLVAWYAARLTAAVALLGVAMWWVTVPHSWDGRILVSLTEYHGVHVTDWPAGLFGLLGVLLLFAPTPRDPEPAVVKVRR